jgi:hypothetical protein
MAMKTHILLSCVMTPSDRSSLLHKIEEYSSETSVPIYYTLTN